MLAGVAIFTTVFALGANPAEGPGLIFIILPSIFPQLAGGILWSTLFFILLFMAALTSAISILEVVTAYFIDQKGWSRKKATLQFGLVITIVGVFCSLSLGGGINIAAPLGMSFFDAICHAMTTMPSGGFSTFNDSINGQGNYVKSVILVFMLITGTNFALHFRSVNLGLKSYQRDREFQYYILACILFTGLILSFSFLNDGNSSPLDVAFQTVSIITTTGYTSTDYSSWTPFISQYLLYILMFTGAMGGSTSGGIKIIRIVALYKYVRVELKRALHEKAIIPVRIGKKVLSDELIRKTLAFFLFYVLFFFLASIIFVMLGDNLESSIGAAASAMGNIGPSIGEYGAMDNYDSMHIVGKYLMMFGMILGRLEIFAVLVLFTRTFWRS